MPNHVTNILDAEDILVLPVYTTDKNGDREFDFNKIIPMPEELLEVDAGNEREYISCYLTKVQDVNTMKLVKDYYDGSWKTAMFKAPHILTEEEITEITGHYNKTFDELAEIGKRYVENIEKYGATDWYSWRCEHWGTKWNSYDLQEIDDDMIEFLTAWSPPEPVIKKLSEMYPDKTFHLLYSDEFIGQFAGEQTYKGGELIDEIYAEGTDHPNMPELINKIFGLNVVECVYIDKDGNLKKVECEGCDRFDECDRLR